MKITDHLVKQIELAQGAGIELQTLNLVKDDSGQAFLQDDSGNPVPPGTPPPIPPQGN